MILKLAWKNIWRNRRRTVITVSSIAFAVLFSVLMRSMQKGMEDQLLNTVVKNNMGYLQIHTKGFWDDQMLDNGFYPSDKLIKKIENIPNIKEVDKKLESGTISSTGTISRGTFLMGYDQSKTLPEKITKNITSGSYPASGKNEILMGEKLAKYLGVDVGDTIIFLGAGYHGSTAAGLYALSGTIDLHMPELNQVVAYMGLGQLQDLMGAPGLVTALMIDLKYPGSIQETKKEIEAIIGPEYEVMTWYEMQPELYQTLQTSMSKGLIMNFILYMIISFVMFGTILMASQERKYELGVMLAIGMKKWRSMLMIVLENLIISLTGVIIGVLMVAPIAIYFHFHPIHIQGQQAELMEEMGFEAIIPFSIDPTIAMNNAIVVLVIATLLLIYPIHVIKKLNPITAMKL